ncbi:MAG: DUF4442 domain-containing protein [Candidatus Pseudobacter hemicellulosilyticus]|uniref:DUF4442 domain-containing protein n=1 Tax=Candidatus Pseudobacter hemicellulosilyticus TaxID=3121375 RepID=A0AAJ5WTM5_9BACT|nr:MAG: DUF4442 domain-containing protein [Pseudobacter sp.]
MSATNFLQLMQHPVKARWFLFSRLPSAFFAGVRIRSVDPQRCVVTVPYRWFSRNPFRSTYFACLAMAGEMSTGALAMAHLFGRKPAVSMLVVKMEASYYKKATGLTSFTCTDGDGLKAAIEKAIASGEAQTFTASATGTNEAGEKVAECWLTWSFKARTAVPSAIPA